MTQVIFVTSADQYRPGLTFRIEFDSDHQFEEWHADKELIGQRRHMYAFDKYMPGANTTIMVTLENGTMQGWVYSLSWESVNGILQRADFGFPTDTGAPGRPQKRVLILTTSKDRRTKAPVSRSASY